MCRYVIITPAFNESKYIEKTIRSVLDQTIQPLGWIIVDDDSTDDTGGIAQKYAEQYNWIHYHYRKKESESTYYSNNVYAIMDGYEHVKGLKYDFLAILDADISLPYDYYERIFDYFGKENKLGVASGVYQDVVNGKVRKILHDHRSTPKAIQVFRRECFEQIGGYWPMKYGGEDTCACFMARMKGWKTWSCPNLMAIHNKPVGTGHTKSLLKIRFRQGIGEYYMATHPLFMLLKSMRRCIKEPPYVIGGLMRYIGFLFAHFMTQERQIPDELVRYIHNEHCRRIWTFNKTDKVL